jgi:3-deoxy-D-manno-octulosonate 8-phosphate phosphatase (KDO 8-P phosphatase)
LVEIDIAIEEKVKRVKLLILDVDGVLTDGSINYIDDGREFKSFNVKDGHGIKLLMRSGVRVAMVTARESEAVAMRAKDLGIDDLYQGQKEKVTAFEAILEKSGVSAEETAYVGDDLIDQPVLRRAGFSVAVSDAVGEVLESVDYVTRLAGGRGAVREIADLILRVQGTWSEVTERYNK